MNEINTASFRKSSYCSSGACVEIATVDGAQFMRDGKNRSGAVLSFGADAWQSFITGVRAEQFSFPYGVESQE